MVSKNQQKIGEANGMPILPTGPTQVTKTGNVGSVDVLGGPSIHIIPQVAGYCTERVVNCLKKSAKIGEANVMPSLPIVATQVALRRNVCSLDAPKASQLFTLGPRGQGMAVRGS